MCYKQKRTVVSLNLAHPVDCLNMLGRRISSITSKERETIFSSSLSQSLHNFYLRRSGPLAIQILF